MTEHREGFEIAYYINLPHRVDRKERFEKLARFLPVNKVERVEAVNGHGMNMLGWPGSPGAFGVRESHIRVLEMAKKGNFKTFFVFEDDAVIKSSFEKKFYLLMDEIGDDWDMVYLYAKNHYLKPLKISKRVMRLQNTLGLVGVAYNARNIDLIIDKLKNDYRWVDSCMADLHLVLKVFAPTESLVFHPKGYSDNVGSFTRSDRLKIELFFLKVFNKVKNVIKRTIS